MLGRIPASRLYAPGLAILNAYPLPNASGAGYNYESQVAVQIDRREEIFRADWQASSAWRVYGRYFHNSNNAGTGVGPYGSFVLGANLPLTNDLGHPSGLQPVAVGDRRAQPDAVLRSDVRHRPQLDLHPRRRRHVDPVEPGRDARCRCSIRPPWSGRLSAAVPARRPLRHVAEHRLEQRALRQLQHDLRLPRQPDEGVGTAHVEGRRLRPEEPEGPERLRRQQRRHQLQRRHRQPVRHRLRRRQRRHRRVQHLQPGVGLPDRRVPLLEHRVVRCRTTGRSTTA